MAANNPLVSLHTAIIDALNGYDEAIKRTERPDLKAVFQRAQALHERAHAELHQALRAKGLTTDHAGSFMSTVNKAIVSAMSAFGLDDGSLSSFASGEQRIVEDDDRAIEDNQYDTSLVVLLARQKHRLMGEISDMKATATSAARIG